MKSKQPHAKTVLMQWIAALYNWPIGGPGSFALTDALKYINRLEAALLKMQWRPGRGLHPDDVCGYCGNGKSRGVHRINCVMERICREIESKK